MQAGTNRDAGNAEFAQKRDSYRASGFAITRKIGEENAEWTPERIAAHQNWMASRRPPSGVSRN